MSSDADQTFDLLSRRQQEHLAAQEAEQARDRQEQDAHNKLSAALERAYNFNTPVDGRRVPTGFGDVWDQRTVAAASDPRWFAWADAVVEAGREIRANNLEDRLDGLRTAPEILAGENGQRMADEESYALALLRLGCGGDREALVKWLHRASADHRFPELHFILRGFSSRLLQWRTVPYELELIARAERNLGLDRQHDALVIVAVPGRPDPVPAPPRLTSTGKTAGESNDALGASPPGDAKDTDDVILEAEDLTILYVLAAASHSLTIGQIAQEADRLYRQSGGAGTRPQWLILIGESKVRERIPVLTAHGLVGRPLDRDGRTTQRKGVGITSKGRKRLPANSPPTRR